MNSAAQLLEDNSHLFAPLCAVSSSSLAARLNAARLGDLPHISTHTSYSTVDTQLKAKTLTRIIQVATEIMTYKS